MKREESLVPWLHLADVEGNLLWNRDGRVTLLYELEAYHEPGLTDEECNQRAFQAEHAWNGMPEGNTYEFLVLADAVRGRRGVEAGWPPIPVADERTRLLERFRAARLAEILREDETAGAGSLVLERRHFFAATFRPRVLESPGVLQKVSNLLGLAPRPRLGGGLDQTWDAVRAEAATFNRRVENGLWQMGLTFRRLQTPDMLSFLYALLNPRSSQLVDLRALPLRPLAERPPGAGVPDKDDPGCSSPLRALLDDDLEVGWDHLVVGGHYVGLVSLKELPDRVSPGVLLPLVTLGRRRYVVSFRVEKPDQRRAMARMRRRGQMAAGLRFQDWIVKTDRKNAQADTIGKQADLAIERAVAAAQKFWDITLQVVLYEGDKDRLDEACAEVLGTMASARGLRGYREAPGLLEAYLSVVPGAPTVNRRRSVMSPIMVDLLPIFDCRPSTGAIPFRTAANTVTWFDPFDTGVNPNANILVTGTSGAGKSMAVQMILSGYEIARAARGETPPCIYIIDCGGSYDRYLRLRPDGASRAFTADSPACIDPFAWDPADGPREDHLSRLSWLLVDVLEVDERDRERFRRILGLVEQALTRLYDGGLPRSFEGLDEGLAGVGGDEAEALRRALWSFRRGRLARLFQGGQSLVGDEIRAIGFDFKGLQGKPDEAAIALRLVVFEIRRRTARLHRQHVRSLVVFDESWMALSPESGEKRVVATAGPFLAESIRTSRKDGGGVIGLSQNISDFHRCPWGPAIIGNSATKLLGFPGGEGEVRDLRELLGLTDRQVRQLVGLRRHRRWHEFLLIQGCGGPTGRSDVIQVSADPLSLWTFGTSPAEKLRMAEVAQQRPELGLFEQIELLAAEG